MSTRYFFYILFLLFCLPRYVPAQVCVKYSSPSSPVVCKEIKNLTDCKKCDADCNEVPNTGEVPPDECMKCSNEGAVRNIDKIKAHNDGLVDCKKAVEEEIGRQYIELEKIYKEAKKIINKEAEKLSKECEKQFDKKGMFYEALVYSCQKLVSTSQGLNLAAAYTTYETGRAALGIALQGGLLECTNLFPCAGR